MEAVLWISSSNKKDWFINYAHDVMFIFYSIIACESSNSISISSIFGMNMSLVNILDDDSYEHINKHV